MSFKIAKSPGVEGVNRCSGGETISKTWLLIASSNPSKFICSLILSRSWEESKGRSTLFFALLKLPYVIVGSAFAKYCGLELASFLYIITFICSRTTKTE